MFTLPIFLHTMHLPFLYLSAMSSSHQGKMPEKTSRPVTGGRIMEGVVSESNKTQDRQPRPALPSTPARSSTPSSFAVPSIPSCCLLSIYPARLGNGSFEPKSSHLTAIFDLPKGAQLAGGFSPRFREPSPLATSAENHRPIPPTFRGCATGVLS